MKKTLLGLAVSMSLASVAQAEYFVAAGLGSTSSDWEYEGTATNGTDTFSASTSDTTDSSSMIALSAGLIESNYRTYAEYNSTSYEEADISFLTINADYLHPLTDKAKLFGGAAIGIANLTWNDDDRNKVLGIDGETASSGSLGFKFGAMFEVGNGDLEVGYRQYTASLETEINSVDGDAVVNETMEITSTSGAYIGYVFSF